MKILVVDDERPIREWLSFTLGNLIDDSDQIISASNGKDAYEKYLEEIPDLIITDIKMPVMTGLELMEKVKKMNQETTFIVLTCHEEFEFARVALRMGAAEYLLKTDIEASQLAAVLEKIRNIHHGTKRNEEIFFDRQRFTVHVLEENLVPDCQSLERIEAYYLEKDYFVMGFKTDKNNQFSQLKESLKLEGYTCEFLPYDKSVIFALIWVERNNSLLMQLNKIQKFAEMAYGQLRVNLGFSRMYSRPEEVGLAIRQALAQLNQGFYRKNHVGFSEFKEPDKDKFDFERETQEIISGIFLDSRQEIADKFEDWLKLVEENAMVDSRKLKSGCIRIMEKMQAKYRNLQFDKKVLMDLETFSDLKSYLGEIMKNLENTNTLHNTEYVTRTLTYIENHYSENCSLERVASEIGLNPEYFSRLFKQNMGQTFSTFLTNYRMEAAKKLLTDTQNSISEIAEKVGYQNLAYFSRVFKKNTGQTPFEYRR